MIGEKQIPLLGMLPLRTLDRYVMRHFLVSYVICTTAVVGMFVVIEALSRLDNFLKQEDPLIFVVGRYFLVLAEVTD